MHSSEFLKCAHTHRSVVCTSLFHQRSGKSLTVAAFTCINIFFLSLASGITGLADDVQYHWNASTHVPGTRGRLKTLFRPQHLWAAVVDTMESRCLKLFRLSLKAALLSLTVCTATHARRCQKVIMRWLNIYTYIHTYIYMCTHLPYISTCAWLNKMEANNNWPLKDYSHFYQVATMDFPFLSFLKAQSICPADKRLRKLHEWETQAEISSHYPDNTITSDSLHPKSSSPHH